MSEFESRLESMRDEIKTFQDLVEYLTAALFYFKYPRFDIIDNLKFQYQNSKEVLFQTYVMVPVRFENNELEIKMETIYINTENDEIISHKLDIEPNKGVSQESLESLNNKFSSIMGEALNIKNGE